MARAAASSAIAFSGLCVGISVAVLLCSLSQSPPGTDVDAAAHQAAAAQLDPAAHGMLAAVATFFTAITIIHIHLRTGRGGGGAGAGDRRIPEVMFFILCASVALLHLLLCMQQPAGSVQPYPAVLLRVAAVRVLPYVGAATFYLSLALTYAHVSTAAAGGAGNEQYPTAVELMNIVALAATLITGALICITAALAFNSK